MSITKDSSQNKLDKGLNSSVNLDLSHHNLNNSSSKQKFSFPKASRFSLSKSICDSFYEIPTTKNGRTTSFGVGNKDMGIRTSRYAPEPATYNIESQFQSSRKSRRGTSFGPGREQMNIGGPLRDSIAKKFIPGPGNYKADYSTLDQHNISLKSRLPDRSQAHLLKNPGPGAYAVEQIGTKRYYATSKYKNRTNSTKISPNSGHKGFSPNKTTEIGPGHYNQNERSINPTGKYHLSNSKNCQTRQFSKSPRQSLVYKHLLQTPGYNYQPFSEFGQP